MLEKQQELTTEAFHLSFGCVLRAILPQWRVGVGVSPRTQRKGLSSGEKSKAYAPCNHAALFAITDRGVFFVHTILDLGTASRRLTRLTISSLWAANLKRNPGLTVQSTTVALRMFQVTCAMAANSFRFTLNSNNQSSRPTSTVYRHTRAFSFHFCELCFYCPGHSLHGFAWGGCGVSLNREGQWPWHQPTVSDLKRFCCD